MSFELPKNLDEVIYLTEDDVVFIHDEVALIEGGRPGILKRADLLSAIGRPEQAAQYDTSADFIQIAAYYWHGISVSHGFVDGNKRTGFLCAISFLAANGIEFDDTSIGPGQKINEWMEKVEFTLDRLDAYLRERCFVAD